MEGSSCTPFGSDCTASDSNMFLSDLPSRGLFSSSIVSTIPGNMRVYVCDHDTSPPDGQEIKTNQQNILNRWLTLKKQKGETSLKDVKGTAGAGGSRKRPADRASDNKNSAKKANSVSRQEDYHRLTVERLRALLKEKGLPCRGRKDELITRLTSANL